MFKQLDSVHLMTSEDAWMRLVCTVAKTIEQLICDHL